MPPITRKRKSHEDVQHDTEEPPAPTKKARRPRAAKKRVAAGPKGPLNEYTVDEGRNSSRNFFNGAVSSKKKRTPMAESRKQLQKKTDDLIAFINSQQRPASSTSEVSAVLDTLQSDLVAAQCTSKTTSKFTTASGGDETLLQQALGSIEALQMSVKRYEDLNKRDTSIKRPEKMLWRQDIKDLRELDSEALAISVRTVSGMIMPKLGASMAPAEANSTERIAWDMLEEGRPCRIEETWGAAAQGLVRGFAGLSRFLPGGK